MPKTPVITPITTDTKADCAAVGASKSINHSAHLHDMTVLASIIHLGSIFHLRNCSTVTISTPSLSLYLQMVQVYTYTHTLVVYHLSCRIDCLVCLCTVCTHSHPGSIYHQ